MRKTIYHLLRKITLPFTKLSLSIRRHIECSFLYQIINTHPLGNRILTDDVFRAEVFLNLGLLISFLYGAVQFIIALLYRSVWLGALAVYHILLAAMRFLLMKHIDKNGIGKNHVAELRRYRLCGIVLLLMLPVFVSILILVVHKNSHGGYPGFLIYLAAIYAFGKIEAAISSARKFRKYGSPVLCAAKEISLIAAMISVLSLETAILSRYGNIQNPAFYQGINGTFSGAFCLFTLWKAVSMINQATREMKEPPKQEQKETLL